MDTKGKVTSVSRMGMTGMYPTMYGELGEPERVRVELELQDGGRVCINVAPSEARSYRVGDEVAVNLSVSAPPDPNSSGT
jgi:hypothetical protein